MKKRTLSVIPAVLIFVILQLVNFLNPARLEASTGLVTYVLGDAVVMRDGNPIQVEFGTELLQGDGIRTGNNTTVVLSLDNRTEIKLRENTFFRITGLGQDIETELESGGVFARVVRHFRGRFSVGAQTVAAGVRGTEFFMAYGRTIDDQPDVWLCVNSGVVEVEVVPTGDSLEIHPGQGINVIAGRRLTEPRRYRWTLRLNWNMDPDLGPVLDDTDLDQAYSDLLDQDYD